MDNAKQITREEAQRKLDKLKEIRSQRVLELAVFDREIAEL